VGGIKKEGVIRKTVTKPPKKGKKCRNYVRAKDRNEGEKVSGAQQAVGGTVKQGKESEKNKLSC